MLNNAHYQIIHKRLNDCLSLIGSFPYIIQSALPNAQDIPRRQDISTNTYVEASLGHYIGQPSASSWNGVLKALAFVATTADAQRSITEALYRALIPE